MRVPKHRALMPIVQSVPIVGKQINLNVFRYLFLKTRYDIYHSSSREAGPSGELIPNISILTVQV